MSDIAAGKAIILSGNALRDILDGRMATIIVDSEERARLLARTPGVAVLETFGSRDGRMPKNGNEVVFKADTVTHSGRWRPPHSLPRALTRATVRVIDSGPAERGTRLVLEPTLRPARPRTDPGTP